MAKMAKRKPGEQMDLIDVHPRNQKRIIAVARTYRQAQAERQEALKAEIEQKEKLLNLIHQAKLKPLDDGKIKFSVDTLTITVTPRDELIQVREKTQPDDTDE